MGYQTVRQAYRVGPLSCSSLFPLAKDLEDFQFEGTPINQTLVNDLASGGFIAQQRNAVLVGGTGIRSFRFDRTHKLTFVLGVACDCGAVRPPRASGRWG